MNKILSKKILITVLVFFVVLAVGLGGYWLLVQQSNSGTQGGGGESRGPLFPFSGSGSPDAPTMPESDIQDGVITTTPGMRPALWRVTERPTVAAIAHTVRDRSDEEKWYIRYVERETMHVYEQEVVSRDKVRLSITNVPRIQEAFFLPGLPDRFVIRYLDSSAENIQTYRATLVPRDQENPPRSDEEKENAYRISGSFLEQNIRSIAPNTTGGLVYSVGEGIGSSIKTVSLDGSVSTLYTTPLREVLVSWPETTTVLLNTKAAYDTPGALIRIAAGSGADRIVMTDRPSLLAGMNTTGDRFVAFTNGREHRSSFSLRNRDGTHRADLSLITIPEKCTWSVDSPTVIYCAIPSAIPGTGFPDTWYQGVTHTEDLLWKIDTETNTTTLLAGQADFIREGADEPLDAINLTVSADDRYLTFIDRKTDELWALRLYTPEL